MIRLAVSGCQGRMGSRILELAFNDLDFGVVCIMEDKSHPAVNSKVRNLLIADNSDLIKEAEVLIEFTTPVATMAHLKDCLQYRKAMVIGTTGLNISQIDQIKEAGREIPVVFSPNMSIGVNIFFRLIQEAAKNLPVDYLVKIVESHHIHKKDAPSGTAKQLAKIIKEARGEEVKDVQSIREGEIVGDHRVFFDGQFDTIELRHSAKTRDIFAQGALVAAKWIANKKPGFYNMQDVLFV
ncbi:MAG: 4-hydroxy-tetrahydrodipicolinate reductase [Candidatus Omnitrophota bacterium]|nr:4-hydroxy-tetrahydrodipicolinate reductase [Candidatus Omnitrophota bacterium]